MKNRIETFLKDITYNSKFTFLNEGATDELKKIAEKRGVQVPSKDLSIFKCIYGFVDRTNKNGCGLPREEVVASLPSLVGKAIDFDHLRKRVVGYWLDAELEGDQIVAYGAFFKSNFPDDYETIETLLKNDNLAISFEAWGDREMKADNTYDLKNIHFAGGALLIKTTPAFAGANVMEMAQSKVLEFASVMKKPTEFYHDIDAKKESKPEFARLYISDIDAIYRMMSEIDCPICGQRGACDVQEMNYVEAEAEMECMACNCKYTASFTPTTEIAATHRVAIKSIKTAQEIALFEDVNKYMENFQGSTEALELKMSNELEDFSEIEESNKLNTKVRNSLSDDDFAVVVTKNGKKIRMFPVHDPTHVRNALSRLAQTKVQQTLQKLGITIDSVKRKIVKKAKELNMKELLQKYQKATIEEVLQEMSKASLKRDITVEELASIKTKVEALEAASEENVNAIIAEFAKAEAEQAKLVEEAKVKADLEKATADLKTAIDKIASLETELATAKALEIELAKVKADLDVLNTAKAEAEKAAVAAKITERKASLAEYAKDMSDEDLLDDAKFELSMLKKEIAELKAAKPAAGSVPPAKLVKGSTDKTKDVESEARNRIDERAFGKK